jgi:hypothetical protein
VELEEQKTRKTVPSIDSGDYKDEPQEPGHKAEPIRKNPKSRPAPSVGSGEINVIKIEPSAKELVSTEETKQKFNKKRDALAGLFGGIQKRFNELKPAAEPSVVEQAETPKKVPSIDPRDYKDEPQEPGHKVEPIRENPKSRPAPSVGSGEINVIKIEASAEELVSTEETKQKFNKKRDALAGLFGGVQKKFNELKTANQQSNSEPEKEKPVPSPVPSIDPRHKEPQGVRAKATSDFLKNLQMLRKPESPIGASVNSARSPEENNGVLATAVSTEKSAQVVQEKPKAQNEDMSTHQKTAVSTPSFKLVPANQNGKQNNEVSRTHSVQDIVGQRNDRVDEAQVMQHLPTVILQEAPAVLVAREEERVEPLVEISVQNSNQIVPVINDLANLQNQLNAEVHENAQRENVQAQSEQDVNEHAQNIQLHVEQGNQQIEAVVEHREAEVQQLEQAVNEAVQQIDARLDRLENLERAESRDEATQRLIAAAKSKSKEPEAGLSTATKVGIVSAVAGALGGIYWWMSKQNQEQTKAQAKGKEAIDLPIETEVEGKSPENELLQLEGYRPVHGALSDQKLFGRTIPQQA